MDSTSELARLQMQLVFAQSQYESSSQYDSSSSVQVEAQADGPAQDRGEVSQLLAGGLSRENLQMALLLQAEAKANELQTVYALQALLSSNGNSPGLVDQLNSPTGKKRKRVDANSANVQQAVQQRKAKKSCREKERRLAINNAFMKLNVLLQSREGVAPYDIVQKNRSVVLEGFIAFLSETMGVTIPEVDENELNPPTNKNGRFVDKSTLSQTEIDKRDKKSRREKNRRDKVNLLAIKVGIMLNVHHYKDRLVVLNKAISFLEPSKTDL